MNKEFVLLLKEQSNIVDIINQYVELKRSGNNYKACCPFHKEKTPSFMVNEQKQSFKCFGCGKGGDVYNFIQEIENVDFQDAVSILANKMGMDIPQNTKHDRMQGDFIKSLKEINLFAGRYYYKNLFRNESAIGYLKERGIQSEMVKSFGLGYSDNSPDLLNQLRKNFQDDLIVSSGIATKKEGKLYLTFRERLMFPIFNNRNEIIAFGGRQLGEWGPKYLNSPETKIYSKKENLYALHIARKNIVNDTIFLVEGYMDVISMHQNGYKNTVATLGTALTPEQAAVLSKIVNNIFILYDNDNAGKEAARKALDILGEANIQARVILLEDAKDPDEYFKRRSKKDFQDRIDSSVDYLLFNIIQIQANHDINSSVGKDSFVKHSVDFIKNYLTKPYARQIYVEESVYYISKISGYSIKSIGVDIYGEYFSPKQFSRTKEAEELVPKSKFEFEVEEEIDKKELAILHGLLMNKICTDDISIEDFIHRKNRKLYYEIKTGTNTSLIPDPEQILSDSEYKMLIRSIKNTKLNRRIEFLEGVQERIMASDDSENFKIALLIGNYIIKLKNLKK